MCVRKINHRKMSFRIITCRDYSKYNHTVLARDIENYDWDPVYTVSKYETFKLRDFIWEKPRTLSTPTKSFNFSYVSLIFVEGERKSLKRRKVTGCDNLPPGILKDAAYALSSPLTHLINLSLTTGLVSNK